MATDRDVPPDATTSVSAAAPTCAASPPSVTVWLAGPAARALFTPEAQSADDLTRWRDIVNTRKREEWEVSRALLAHVRGELGAGMGGERAGADGELLGRAAEGAVVREGSVICEGASGTGLGSAETSLAGAQRAALGADAPMNAAGHSELLSVGGSLADAHRAALGGSDAPASDDGGGAGTNAAGDVASLSSASASAQRVRPRSVAPCGPEGVALSLSHSGGYAAAAASRVAVRVGVDLECERPRDVTRIARFAFTEREVAQLEALATAEERLERFYILWTLKEAFAKALSLPLLASLRRCTFLEDGDAWRGSVSTDSAWIARTFRASSTLVVSVVAVLPEGVSAENFSVSTHEWPAPVAAPWRTLATVRSGA
jgi:4'-phosphopantetheinyl transferase